MNIGTRSILFGVHQPFIHAFFMNIAWLKTYGFTLEYLDPRLHLAFLLHDIGYWGCESMDGEDGERHPELGAKIMDKLFGAEWFTFCICHSGTMVKKLNRVLPHAFKPSKLYAVDKLASPLYPKWLYRILACLSGEWKEYAEITYGKKSSGVLEPIDQVNLLPNPEEYGYGKHPLMEVRTFDEWWNRAMPLMRERARIAEVTTHKEIANASR